MSEAAYTIDPVTGTRYLKIPPITDGQRQPGRGGGLLWAIAAAAALGFFIFRDRRVSRRRR